MRPAVNVPQCRESHAKMRRNVVSLIKFFFLAAFTVFLTVVVFRYMRTPPNRQLSTPLDALVAAVAVDRKSPGDNNRESDERLDQVIERKSSRSV